LLDEVDVVERHANNAALRDDTVQQIDLVAGLRQQGSPHEAEVIAEKRRADIDRVKVLQMMALPNGAKTQLLMHTNANYLLDLCILLGLFDRGYQLMV
jgi:hypothetical protein